MSGQSNTEILVAAAGVAEAIEVALKEIKGKEDEITGMKRELGLEGGEVEEDIISNLSLSDNTSKLTNAVSSLPELLEKKRLIDMHCRYARFGYVVTVIFCFLAWLPQYWR